MQDFADQHPGLFIMAIAAHVAGVWMLAAFLISWMSGWRALGRQFRLQGSWPSQSWSWQSASLRFRANYNNCLIVGADAGGLYLRVSVLFRFMHPDLFVPWSEIQVGAKKRLWFIELIKLSLGRELRIPFTIRTRLYEKLRQAAGSGLQWQE